MLGGAELYVDRWIVDRLCVRVMAAYMYENLLDRNVYIYTIECNYHCIKISVIVLYYRNITILSLREKKSKSAKIL